MLRWTPLRSTPQSAASQRWAPQRPVVRRGSHAAGTWPETPSTCSRPLCDGRPVSDGGAARQHRPSPVPARLPGAGAAGSPPSRWSRSLGGASHHSSRCRPRGSCWRGRCVPVVPAQPRVACAHSPLSAPAAVGSAAVALSRPEASMLDRRGSCGRSEARRQSAPLRTVTSNQRRPQTLPTWMGQDLARLRRTRPEPPRPAQQTRLEPTPSSRTRPEPTNHPLLVADRQPTSEQPCRRRRRRRLLLLENPTRGWRWRRSRRR